MSVCNDFCIIAGSVTAHLLHVVLQHLQNVYYIVDLLVDDFHFIYIFIVLQGGVGVAIKAIIRVMGFHY